MGWGVGGRGEAFWEIIAGGRERYPHASETEAGPHSVKRARVGGEGSAAGLSLLE